jgi:hypothetical protein
LLRGLERLISIGHVDRWETWKAVTSLAPIFWHFLQKNLKKKKEVLGEAPCSLASTDMPR